MPAGSITRKLGVSKTVCEMSLIKKSDIKQCTTCKQFKDVRDFYVDRKSRDGRQTQCKFCKNAAIRLSEYRAGKRRSPDLIKQDDQPIDPNRSHKICNTCEVLKPLTDFYKESRTRDGYQARCKACQKSSAQISYAENKPTVLERQKRNYSPEERRDRTLRENYGITEAEYEQMLDKQNGQCEICGSPDPFHNSNRFVVDHCHATGNVRGLLCGECNFMLGKSKDDIQLLESAIAYLRRYQQN